MTNPPINEALLDDKLAQLEQARAWSPRVISRLETLIRTGDDYDLFRINPIQYAAERSMNENEAIDLFLYATKFGLFEMEWHLVCPSCGHVVESFDKIRHVHTHFVCQACQVVVDVSLDDYIQITFTISLQIRDNAFRYPDKLSLEDFFFKYHLCKGLTTSSGENIVEVMSRQTKHLVQIEPGQTITLEIETVPGILLLNDFEKNPMVNFIVMEEPAPQPQNILIHVVDGRYQAVTPSTFPIEVTVGAFTHKAPQIAQIQYGKVIMQIDNQMALQSRLWILNSPFDVIGSEPLKVDLLLTGKRLLNSQTFRNLFRSEVVQTDEGIGVRDITFLFTDLKGSTAMYDQIGDAKAYYLVRQHFDTLGKVIAKHSGAIVKTIGDAVMATFMNPADALQAAVEMLHEIETFNRSITEDIILKIGIHRGHSIVVTLNERLDYFGQTVNIAARVQGLADANEIYISEDAYQYPGMEQITNGNQVTAATVDVKGVSARLNVYRIAPSVDSI